MNLFRTKAFHVQAVEALPTGTQTQPTPKPPVDWTKITLLAQDTVKQTAVVLGTAYAGKKVIDAVSEIVILAAKAKLK